MLSRPLPRPPTNFLEQHYARCRLFGGQHIEWVIYNDYDPLDETPKELKAWFDGVFPDGPPDERTKEESQIITEWLYPTPGKAEIPKEDAIVQDSVGKRVVSVSFNEPQKHWVVSVQSKAGAMTVHVVKYNGEENIERNKARAELFASNLCHIIGAERDDESTLFNGLILGMLGLGE